MTDPKQFEAFMEAYQHMVYNTAARLLGNHAEAEDVAQEVFLRAYDRFASIKDQPTVGGWLRTVARNLSLNHLTRHRSRWRLFTDLSRPEPDQPDYQDALPAEDRTEEHSEQSDQGRLMESFLMELPQKQRVPLVLYHFENLSYEEIAQSLGISLGKVKTDIRRGRESLKSKLLRSDAARAEWDIPNPVGCQTSN